MDTATDLLKAIPDSALFASAGALLVSIALQYVKKWAQLQSDKVIAFVLLCLSFVPVAISYITNEATLNPNFLGKWTFIIMGLSQLAYRFAVKPVTNVFEDAKKLRVMGAQAGLAGVEFPSPVVPVNPNVMNAVTPQAGQYEETPVHTPVSQEFGA